MRDIKEIEEKLKEIILLQKNLKKVDNLKALKKAVNEYLEKVKTKNKITEIKLFTEDAAFDMASISTSNEELLVFNKLAYKKLPHVAEFKFIENRFEAQMLLRRYKI